MSELLLIVIMMAGVFALRVSGLLLQDLRIPGFFERTLRYAPIALVSALAVSSLAGQVPDDPLRLLPAGGSALLVLYARRMWLGILGGFGLYWVLRLFFG